jgi:diguanylate cyclase (GGDEF)-like protein
MVIIALVVSYTVAIFFIALPKIDTTIKEIEEQNAKLVLDKIVYLTENVAKSLEAFKKESLVRHKQELKNIIDIVHGMMEEAYPKKTNDPKELERCKEELLERINQLRYGDQNYIFVVDYNATVLSHPFIAKGEDMSHVVDIKGNPIVPRLIEVARKNGEGFTHYWWKKNNGDDTPYEKLSYSRDCKRWSMVVGTGVYIDDIEKEIQRRKKELFAQLRTIMKQTRIGKTGYIYIFDEHRMVLHPNSNIDGKNFKKLPNPGQGTFIYDDLVKAAKGLGVLHYKWDKPSDKGNYVYEKISWIKYIPSMNLYVVSSAYVSELEEISTDLHNKIIYLGLAILILSLLLSTLYLHRLFRPIHELSVTADIIAKGDYKLRTKIYSDDEIGILATNFNLMVDRLEEQIKNLDRKVKKKTEALRELAITDPLTKLYNRRYFSEISTRIYDVAQRESEALSVMMLDIDKFKNINDTYGHQVGDQVIITLAKIINEIKRESDVVCRYGGEEFIMLLPKTSKAGALDLAQRIRVAIERYEILIEEKNTTVRFTVSLGVSEVDYSKDSEIEDVIRRADNAMYIAKREGRNRTYEL